MPSKKKLKKRIQMLEEIITDQNSEIGTLKLELTTQKNINNVLRQTVQFYKISEAAKQKPFQGDKITCGVQRYYDRKAI